MGEWERGQGTTHYLFGGIQEYNVRDCWEVYALLRANANLGIDGFIVGRRAESQNHKPLRESVTCLQMQGNCLFPVECVNGSSVFECGDQVSVVTRVMVSQNRLYNNSEEVVALRVFTEVIEIEGKQVYFLETLVLLFNDFVAEHH